MLVCRNAHDLGAELNHTLQRELQQAFVSDQGSELLGEAFAADGPKAGAGAAAQHNWGDRGHGDQCELFL